MKEFSFVESSGNEKSSKKKRYLIGTACAVVLLLATAAAWLVLGSFLGLRTVSDQTVETDLQNSSLLAEGVVSPLYTQQSSYRLTSFTVTGREKDLAEKLGFSGKACQVAFSATIENEAFRTELEGSVHYARKGARWKQASEFQVIAQHTTPLQGVVCFDGAFLSSDAAASEEFLSAEVPGASSATLKAEGFSSSLEQVDGTWHSEASQKATAAFWFADDEMTWSQLFVFDNDAGWMPQERMQYGGETVWKLAGKTFELDVEQSSLPASSMGENFASLSFEGQIAPSESADKALSEGAATLRYSVDFSPKRTEDALYRYSAVELSGTFDGVLRHTLGQNSFSLEGEDAGEQVRFQGRGLDDEAQAGSSDAALTVSLSSESEFAALAGSGSHPKTYAFEDAFFALR